MRIDTLSLRGYRNYAEAAVQFDGAVNVFAVGEDGKLTLTENKATSVGASYISFYDVK